MNTSSRCRNGNRNLNRRPDRRLGKYVSRRLDGRPYRAPNWLGQACSAIDPYLRLRQKAACQNPHLFGPHAGRYFRDTRQLAEQQVEIDAAFNKIYGPSPPDQPSLARRIWHERYVEAPANKKVFLKWFKEQYGP